MKDVPPMSKKQAQFFAGIIIICTVTAAIILAIDFQIKGAILEQANRLRLDIERATSGQKPATASTHGPGHHAHHDDSYPSDLVRSGNARVEKTGDIGDFHTETLEAYLRRVDPGRGNGTSGVPGTDIESES